MNFTRVTIINHICDFSFEGICTEHIHVGESYVYNICLISISDTVSDGGSTKTLVLNIESAQHNNNYYCLKEFEPDALNTLCGKGI